MTKEHEDFYQRLRVRIRAYFEKKGESRSKWSEYLLLAPDLFHLMSKLAMDAEVPSEHKGKLLLAIAYFISPLDLIPEGLTGPVGYIDDIALAAFVLNGMINQIKPEILNKYWAGEEDVLNTVQRIVNIADDMIGSGLWKKIKKMFDRND